VLRGHSTQAEANSFGTYLQSPESVILLPEPNNIPSSLDHGIEAQYLVYAVINEIKVLDHGTNCYHFYQAIGPTVIIDLNQVQCVIGQMFD
jgi:hypothetical protein